MGSEQDCAPRAEGEPNNPLFVGAVRIDELFRDRVQGSRCLRFQLHLKRGFDIAASFFLIILSSPILLVSIVAVRFSSIGPTIFSQMRWGINETQFNFFKIRSMFLHQEKLLVAVPAGQTGEKGRLLKMKNDPRVTWVGAVLRKTSIDELPQLLNVIRGDMSMVGPRPLTLPMLEPFPEIRKVRSVLRPGITGLWQVRNRSRNTTVMDMIDDDAEYIKSFNLLLDLKILLATPWAVIRAKGAY